jgi:hypothetical protein
LEGRYPPKRSVQITNGRPDEVVCNPEASMSIKQLTPQALTELADRIHRAKCLVRFEGDRLIVDLVDHTGQKLSLVEVRKRLTTLANDMYSTAGLITAAALAKENTN